MKTAIKLVLIDLLIAQIIAPILIMIPCTIYLFVTTGNLDKVTLTQMIMIPAQLAGQIMMGIYLWKAGYISKKKATWLPVSAPYLVCSAIAILTCGFAVSSLMSLLDWIPNIMEQSFNILQSGWVGILAISPCQQDTDQKSRKDLGGIYMKDTEQKCGNQNCFSRIVLLK